MKVLGYADVFLTGKWTGCSGDTPGGERKVCRPLNKTGQGSYGIVAWHNEGNLIFINGKKTKIQ